MHTIDALSVGAERNDNLKKAKLENGFYNIIDGEKVAARKRLPVISPATGKQLAGVPDVDHALLNKAISDARNAFSGWGAVPFGRRKAILACLLNKIDDHADELSALLAAEQGGPLAQARWEIDLLTEAFGSVLMQMAPPEKEQDAQPIEQITKRYVPIDGSGAISDALKQATSVPMGVAERAVEVAKIAANLKPITNPNMKSDLTTAIALAKAAIEGALANVEINLDSLKNDSPKDSQFVSETRKRSDALKSSG